MIEISKKESDIKYASCISCSSKENVYKVSMCPDDQRKHSVHLCKSCLHALGRVIGAEIIEEYYRIEAGDHRHPGAVIKARRNNMVETYVREVQAIKIDGSNVQEIADFLGVEIRDIKIEEVEYIIYGKTTLAKTKVTWEGLDKEVPFQFLKGEYLVKEKNGVLDAQTSERFEKFYKKK